MAKRILLVEDDLNMALLLQYNLEAAGYAVEHVARGDTAEHRIKEQMPDLVLLDWIVPGTSGIELCRRIRKQLHLDKLPIIIMTARMDRADHEYAIRVGATDLISKPFVMSDIVSRAQTLMGLEASAA